MGRFCRDCQPGGGVECGEGGSRTNPLLHRFPQLPCRILALHTFDVEALRPRLQDSVIDVFLRRGIAKGECQLQRLLLRPLQLELVKKRLQGLSNEGPELLGISAFEVVRKFILVLL